MYCLFIVVPAISITSFSLHSLQDGVGVLEQQSVDLADDERKLESQLKRRQAELLRGQKRLESLTNVRPAFMDEYERLEVELAQGAAQWQRCCRASDCVVITVDWVIRDFTCDTAYPNVRLHLPNSTPLLLNVFMRMLVQSTKHTCCGIAISTMCNTSWSWNIR